MPASNVNLQNDDSGKTVTLKNVSNVLYGSME